MLLCKVRCKYCLYTACSLSTVLYWYFFFFFSSRRRHTRYWRDWSSDVCSSDLPTVRRVLDGRWDDLPQRHHRLHAGLRRERSEERRVGKECRSRWWPCH